MPSEKQPFYDPIPPTYDEALASGSRYAPPRSPVDERGATETESQSLLHHSNGGPGSSRRPNGYRPPTVESEDEESLWDSDSDDDEADHVRREMQEMDMEEPERTSRGSLWRKRIGLSFSLPQWKWSWRPRLPRLRIQLPSRAPVAEDEANNAEQNNEETTTPTRRWRLRIPKWDSAVALIFFARILAIFLIMGFLYLIFSSNILGGIPGQLPYARFDAEDLRIHVQRNVDPRRMRAAVKHFSSYAHIAGSEGDYATAVDVQTMFHRAKLDQVEMDEYQVYLNYPKKDGRAVEILDAKGEKATWAAALEEKEMGGETAGHQTYAFHGHSKSGDVRGPLIYANYGSRDDFKKLKDSGIDTKGAIALVRYYGTQGDRALKVKAAELAGFAGCIIYSDPADDGFRKGDVAPKGPFMPADGVQRGAVSLMSWVVGDVLTPGWESTKGQPRMKVNETPGLVRIPSLPLAWRDAQVLLQHLKGYGDKVSKDWQGGVPDIEEWWTGNSSSPIVRLKNEQDEIEQQPIWNVYGRIVGVEQSAKSIIIGNHRDAWSFGATDPHTGTAIMIETARIFGDLVQRGWRPLRTIEFMSWDAEEYNLIGSTEYVEKNLKNLRENAFAYINLDTVIAGNEFHAAGSPVLKKALLRALGRVGDPNFNATLKSLWEERGGALEGLGAGSDYVAFQDIAGTSSLDLSFTGQAFPYHSSYDNFELMERVIDPEFVYHGLMCQVLCLLLLELTDSFVLPFDMTEYGVALEQWVGELESWTSKQNGKPKSVSFKEMSDAVELIKKNADNFSKWESKWKSAILSNGNWETTDYTIARKAYNSKMADFETALLDLEPWGGVPNRTQFRHVVFGPQLWSGYDEAFFPAIRDTVETKDWTQVESVIAKTAKIMRDAAAVLVV
ncbi:N-acetylated-alpha-linked acidic dipeptidase 2 [Paramyrothecium foliicola]|nr:N-acetylated-alpha-linked acidic dipeptidase 2 [Paramyrothecium foliicola]